MSRSERPFKSVYVYELRLRQSRRVNTQPLPSPYSSLVLLEITILKRVQLLGQHKLSVRVVSLTREPVALPVRRVLHIVSRMH